MEVKRKARKGTDTKTDARDKRVAQGDITRAALFAAARKLFGEQGYADTSTEEIVAAAGVTKGALYHHFTDKVTLFRVVFETVEQEVSDKVVVEFLRPDALESLHKGCRLWIEAHLDPEVRRIALTDARAVLGWEDARSIETRYGAVALRGALRKAMYAGVLQQRPLRPLALMLAGALGEACLYVADSEDQDAATDEACALIVDLLFGLRVECHTDAGAPSTPS
jgi:AcrR family transcriptional regulator